MTERYESKLLGIPIPVSGTVDVYSGVARLSGRIWANEVKLAGTTPTTAVVLLHPTSNFLGHYALEPLADRGVAAIGFTTRYVGNDSSLLLENCLIDIGAGVRFLREAGYERVVLIGNSGGGCIVPLYQAQATHPTITSAPCGGGPDLTQAQLDPIDGIILLNAHPSRALVYTHWLDPSISDEHQPFDRDATLDIFESRNGPPFSEAFLATYRAAQLARSHRITEWAKEQLVALADRGGPYDFPFVVHGTSADPRFLDATIDPSDRALGTPWGPPHLANYLPNSLGHFVTLRGFLSQWSIETTNGDARKNLRDVEVPVLVVAGTGDEVVFPSEIDAMYRSIGSDDHELVEVKGATHYFLGQREELMFACDTMQRWLRERGFLQ
jgi:pimeloyl-ACP methyl ester carboxylesterase